MKGRVGMKQIGLIGLIIGAILFIAACQSQLISFNTEDSKKSTFDFIGQKVSEFSTMTYRNEAMTNSFFENKKLTMVNFWSPSCKPCIEELPELDALKLDLESMNVQLMTVCVDGKSSDVAELMETFKMDYPIIVLGKQSFMKECIENFEFIPFTIFIDQEGKYHSKYIIGSQTREEYLKQIQEILAGR